MRIKLQRKRMVRFFFSALCAAVASLICGCVAKQAIELAQKNQRVIEQHANAACDLGEDTAFAALSTEIRLAMAEYALETYRKPKMTAEERDALWQRTQDRIQQNLENLRQILREGWQRLRRQFAFAHEANTLNLVALGGLEGFFAILAKGAAEGVEEFEDTRKQKK